VNLDNNPTKEQLRALLSACDDRAGHHVLWVTKTGDVRLSPIPKDHTPVGFQEDHPEMQLRLETFQTENDYVGPNAAKDAAWVSDLFETLCDEWAKAKGKAGVAYVDQF
jgi:hypothetical protein